MGTAISLLRGVNVGGKTVSMDQIRRCYESLGFTGVRTYIQSGNVVFHYQKGDSQGLAGKLERGIRDDLGFDVRVIIRTKEEMLRVIENFPFTRREEGKSHVTFLIVKPPNVPVDEIDEVRAKEEKFSISGREIYLFCPNGYGRTKLSNSFFERKLNVSATTRNCRTVNTLYALAAG